MVDKGSAGGSDDGHRCGKPVSWRQDLGGKVRAIVPAAVKKQAARALRRSTGSKAPWAGSQGLRRREYASEQEYLDHQKSKLDERGDFIREVDIQLERVLGERMPDAIRGRNVLCLAARLGGEVRAFRAAGSFAVGIDLNPGDGNCWVLPGNFHALDFAADSVDLVYTNSLDHALELDRVAEEIERVVKPDGRVVLEVGLGHQEGGAFGNWEATAWDRVDDVVDIFRKRGFREIGERRRFNEPWVGEQVVLRRL